MASEQEDLELGDFGQELHTGSRSTPGSKTDWKSQWVNEFIREAKKEKDRREGLQQLLFQNLEESDERRLTTVLATDVDVNALDWSGKSALHIVAEKGSTTKLRLLLGHPRLEVDLQDDRGMTALHLAAISSNIGCIEMLLAAGASTEAADHKGHLPRHYAQQPKIVDLFDTPRRPTGDELGDLSATSPSSTRVDEISFLQSPPGATMDQNLASSLKGSFWEPESHLKWEKRSVWDLIYSEDEVNVLNRQKGKKWFHLPGASQKWAQDLVKRIYSDSGKPASDAQKICKFIRNVFKQVDTEGPCMEYHFQREKKSRRHLGDEEAVAIVLPVIDVDRKNYIESARKIQEHELWPDFFEEAISPALHQLYGLMWSPSVEETHIMRMLQLYIYHDQALPRTLDQSYHGTSVDSTRLAALDGEQVFTKYLTMLKDSKYTRGSQRTIETWGEKPGSAVGTADAREEKARQTDMKSAPDEFVVVPYFWLFKLNQDTIITMYPERWDKTSEANLHMHLLDQTSNNSDACRGDVNMIHITEHIIRSCMNFEASAFFKWKPTSFDQEDVQISYTTAFANSIGKLYLEVVDCYKQLQRGLGSLSMSPTVFYRSVESGTQLLIRIDDIIGEIGMIRRIQTSQTSAAKTLSAAIWGDLGQFRYLPRENEEGMVTQRLENREALELKDERAEKRRKREEQYTLSVIGPFLDTFSLLEADAVRVRSMLTMVLDLRHREAAIENALSGKSQSTMLFIFTTITVLFAPLSFVSSLLALKIEDLPDMWNKPPLASVFGYATLATTALCAIMWIIYKLFTYQTAKRRNNAPPQQTTQETQRTARVIKDICAEIPMVGTRTDTGRE